MCFRLYWLAFQSATKSYLLYCEYSLNKIFLDLTNILHFFFTMASTKAPSTRIRFCLKTEIFSFGLSYAHTRLVKTVTEYASFRKRSLEWSFLKTLPSRRRVGGQKQRVFSNTMMSKIISFSIV